MFDFNKYDDIVDFCRFDGFIDPNGYFYKVVLRKNKGPKDTHNEWASAYISERINIKDFRFNPTISALFTLTKIDGPANILINCFGYVYYSHDPYYYKPIIKLPDPKIANFKVTEEQLDTLYNLMIHNNENTDISIFSNENEDYNYSGLDDDFLPIRR